MCSDGILAQFLFQAKRWIRLGPPLTSLSSRLRTVPRLAWHSWVCAAVVWTHAESATRPN